MSPEPSGVDWSLATATALRLVQPGPELPAREVAEVVAELRDSAQRAEAYVTQVTGLHAAAGPGEAPVLVVDRPGWIRANVDALSAILTPLTDKITAQLGPGQSGPSSAPPWLAGLGARAAGIEVGVLMSYLAPKILGQFDPYFEPTGRLLLVAPNVAQIERELRVPSRDFRLWVCLHEETHRVQFTAVPWLREHMRAQIAQVVAGADLGPDALGEMIRTAVQRITSRRDGEEVSLLDLVQTPDQRVAIDRITAIMTLLEGHADYMMDQVGPDVIGSVVQIRAKFDQRRGGQGFDRVIRRLLGLDAKLRQYREGAAFCRTVIGSVGLDGFNRVWTGPETLPTREEISAPQRWIDRAVPGVLGSAG